MNTYEEVSDRVNNQAVVASWMVSNTVRVILVWCDKSPHQWVTAFHHLSNTEWYQANYFSSYSEAAADFLDRVGYYIGMSLKVS